VVQAREIRMKHLTLMAAVIPILVLIAPSHLAFAYNDPKHCNGYDVCFSIGYDDGYSDAQKGLSPAYAGGAQVIMSDFALALEEIKFTLVQTQDKPQVQMFMVIIIKLVLTNRQIIE